MNGSILELADEDHGVKKTNRQFNLKLFYLVASIIFFLISLPLDGFYSDSIPAQNTAPGYALLLSGWAGVLNGMFTWLANPVLLITWFLIPLNVTRRTKVGFALVGVLFSLSFLLHSEIWWWLAGSSTHITITGYGKGYWFWVISTVNALLACLFEDDIKQQSEEMI